MDRVNHTTRIWVDKKIRKIIIQTTDPVVKPLLEIKQVKTTYQFWNKSWVTGEVIDRIYDNPRPGPNKDGVWTFKLGLGWTAYVTAVFKNQITAAERTDLLTYILSDSYRTTEFPMLRDYQNTDILHMLKYKIGLFTVHTGYGKTQVIATLADYAANGLGKNVLLVTPGRKAEDELRKRCKSVFGIEVNKKGGKVDSIITSGLMSRLDVKKDPNADENWKKKLAKYDWVLVDEVEYTINPGGEFLYDRLIDCQYFYGFSGTSDKHKGRMISFANGLDETVANNKNLIKYFGPSLVYRMPVNLSVTNITIKTDSLDNIEFDDLDRKEDTNVYALIMTKIWTDPEVCKDIVALARKYPLLFIPINNLNAVIQEWIEKYFIGKFRVLLISFRGYTYTDLNGVETDLTLEEACNYIKAGKVDVIPSTSSGYRALDFPNLENILLIQGKVAGVVLQSIGRVARGNHLNIITLAPQKASLRLPVYTKGAKERDEMIQEYYKYCKLEYISEEIVKTGEKRTIKTITP